MDDTIAALLERIVGVYAPDVPSARAGIRLVLEGAYLAGRREALEDVFALLRIAEKKT